MPQISLEGNVNLGGTGDNHNFSNPMYEAMGSGGASGVESKEAEHMQSGTKGLYEVPLDSEPVKTSHVSSTEPLGALTGTQAPVGASKPLKAAPSSKLAILSPSAILQKSAPTLNLRPKELSPSSRDTGKDTQSLVTEDDNSECWSLDFSNSNSSPITITYRAQRRGGEPCK